MPYLIGFIKKYIRKAVKYCFALLLFDAIATVLQLYLGGDMMYKIRRGKPEPTLLSMQEVFSFPHRIGMVCEELAFGDAMSYTQWGNGLQHS